ncbi:MAG: hypothetical protein ABIQ57_15155 [Candidatus Kapaibacterium sp.]
MNNVSTRGEQIFLNPGKRYYVIDSLYINDARNHSAAYVVDDLDLFMREIVFPYTKYPFATITTQKIADPIAISIEDIRSSSDKTAAANPYNCFASDTGLIVFCRDRIFPDIIARLDYDELVDTHGRHEDINLEYWNGIVRLYDPRDLALVLTTGVGSGHEFAGSGFYHLASEFLSKTPGNPPEL